jgi:hypothetical protein
MRIPCWYCHKSVSSELPDDALLRAIAICPECIEKSPEASDHPLTIAQLRAALDEARGMITKLVEIVCSGGAPALGELNPSENLAAEYYQHVANIIENKMVPWLEANPEETNG